MGFSKLYVGLSHRCISNQFDSQIQAVRGGGFSIVAFDRLPQALLILYGKFCSNLKIMCPEEMAD
jgi:hypothetical protein